MRNFRELEIWKKGIQIVKMVYALSSLLPTEEKYGLKSQIQRAVVSMPSNIAEGCSRNSEIEFKRFLEISIGSSFEIETQLIIIRELNLADSKIIDEILKQNSEFQKMTNSLITKIKNSR